MLQLLDTRSTAASEEEVQRSVGFDRAARAKREATPGAVLGARLQLSARAGHDACAGLHAVACPALLLCGEFDGIAPPALSVAMASMLATARLARFPGGHLMLKFGAQHRAVWDCVWDFLAQEGEAAGAVELCEPVAVAMVAEQATPEPCSATWPQHPRGSLGAGTCNCFEGLGAVM